MLDDDEVMANNTQENYRIFLVVSVMANNQSRSSDLTVKNPRG